jgi:hypothetical protein
MRRFVPGLCALILILPVAFEIGCTNREYTRTPRTGTEQLLLSQALEKSMGGFQLPLGAPATVAVEVAGFVGERYLLEPGFLPNGPMVNNNTSTGSGTTSMEPNPVNTPSFARLSRSCNCFNQLAFTLVKSGCP